MADIFDGILGQPQVRTYLRRCIDGGRVSHAYLFTGPAGSNKTSAAYAFAQALLCKDGGCRTCETCRKISRRKHPDVRFYAPAGANGYLVEQIREIVSDMALAPIQASRKVYILDRADMLNASSANAFLKSLEEPPGDVLIILLGRTVEAVLPTIVSRCQVVPFRFIPPQEACGIICQKAAVSEQRARVALEACDGSISRAIEFCSSNERMAFRTRVLAGLSQLRDDDDWDVLQLSAAFIADAKVPLQAIRQTQEQEFEEYGEYLSRSALKQIEARNKRAISAKSFESLHQLTAIIRSWVRDIMVTCAGTPDLVINVDVRASIDDAAALTDEVRAAGALAQIQRYDSMFAYNVSPQSCMDALLLSLRDILFDSASSPHGMKRSR